MGQKNICRGFASYVILLIGLAVTSVFILISLNHYSNEISSVNSALKKIPGLNKGIYSNSSQNALLSPGQTKEVSFTATFEIYTKGTRRIFTDPRYHNLSPSVYITASEPSTVFVKKEGISWNDFFKTLPMQLTYDCLVTGTQQTFCTGEDGVLRFFINENENRSALDLKIEVGDNLKVTFE